MPRHREYVPHGVIPAVLLPFRDDLSIDETAYRAHLRDVAAVDGVTALTINAHASEVASCTFDEQRRVLEASQDEVGARVPLIHGVYADGSLEAARIARMATDGGASALLVFPPTVYALGQRPAMAVEHFKRVAGESDLPLVVFQYPLATAQGYPLETLLRIIDAVPTVRAIKDWCANPQLHERQVRTLQALDPAVNVLSAHSTWLMGSLELGCKGVLSGSGSVIAELHARLFRAVQAGDAAEARALNERIWPTVEAFYADPIVDMHNRMKEALVLMGKLPRAVVRPPLMKLPGEEIERLRRALVAAGLLRSAEPGRRAA